MFLQLRFTLTTALVIPVVENSWEWEKSGVQSGRDKGFNDFCLMLKTWLIFNASKFLFTILKFSIEIKIVDKKWRNNCMIYNIDPIFVEKNSGFADCRPRYLTKKY